LVCLNQFHDILPGTSIGEVYTESLHQYAEIIAIGKSIQKDSFAILSKPYSGNLTIINPTSFTRDDLALLPHDKYDEGLTLEHLDGSSVNVQRTQEGYLLDAGSLLPYSITPLTRNNHLKDDQDQVRPLTVTTSRLENDFLRVELNEAGDIERIFDKEMQRIESGTPPQPNLLRWSSPVRCGRHSKSTARFRTAILCSAYLLHTTAADSISIQRSNGARNTPCLKRRFP
jgi:alpha-mannosidase